MTPHLRASSRRRIMVYPTINAFAIGLAVLLMTTGSWGVASAQEHSDLSSQDVPPECIFPSRIGEVTFGHQLHAEDLEIECVTCHHEVNAKTLKSPHEEYFQDFWIRCTECHHDEDHAMPAKKCSACHYPSKDVTDQTLSSKVVVHMVCSECHEIGTGATASSSCAMCHTGTRLPW